MKQSPVQTITIIFSGDIKDRLYYIILYYIILYYIILYYIILYYIILYYIILYYIILYYIILYYIILYYIILYYIILYYIILHCFVLFPCNIVSFSLQILSKNNRAKRKIVSADYRKHNRIHIYFIWKGKS